MTRSLTCHSKFDLPGAPVKQRVLMKLYPITVALLILPTCLDLTVSPALDLSCFVLFTCGQAHT